MAEAQLQIDRQNAAFWDELCGTSLATGLGISEPTPENLAAFDEAYLELYPYLDGYLPTGSGRTLEIGLGYGTVSQMLAGRGLDYNGLDIAQGPVDMVRHRLSQLGIEDPETRVQRGSVLEMPHPDEYFDNVVAIGCLHHTGDLPRAVAQVHRVLRPGGEALVMIYNKNSARRAQMALGRIPDKLRGRGSDDEAMRASYDHNAEGEAAPATEYTSVRQARKLFGDFSKVKVRRENFDTVAVRNRVIPRETLLKGPGRIAGLDLYITATK